MNHAPAARAMAAAAASLLAFGVCLFMFLPPIALGFFDDERAAQPATETR